MKKLIVLLAGLSLISGNLLAENKSGFSYDFDGTELEFNHDLHNANNGTFYTEDHENTVDLNLNLRKGDTVMTLGSEFTKDGEDALNVTLNHKIFDRLEVQVKGELNFGAASGGFKAAQNEDFYVKYTPENSPNLELGFYPYDMDMTIGDELEIEYKGTDVDGAADEIKVPGIRFTYKASENSTLKLGLGSRQNGKSVTDSGKEDIYHLHASYAYEGESLNFEAAGVFNTQDEKNVISTNEHSVAGYEYTANLRAGYKFTDKFNARAEVASVKGLTTGAETGTAYFVEIEYDTDWTFDSKADSSFYANFKYQDKNYIDGIGKDGLTTAEMGMHFAFDKLTMTPLISYEKAGEKVFTDMNNEATDNNVIVGFKINYCL